MAKKTNGINFPTFLTISRMVLVIPFAICCSLVWKHPEMDATSRLWCCIAVVVLFVVASVTDFIDGKYARKHKIVTDLGAFLDPLADKMLVNTAFLYLVLMGLAPVWMIIVILWRDFAVDGMRMMIARKGETVSASIFGKAKTMTQMITLSLIFLNLIFNNGVIAIIGMVLLYVVIALTIFSGFDYLKKGWSKAIK